MKISKISKAVPRNKDRLARLLFISLLCVQTPIYSQDNSQTLLSTSSSNQTSTQLKPNKKSTVESSVSSTIETTSKRPSLKEPPLEAAKPINPDVTFTPSEEISEDKPVAFPVDI